MLVRPARAASLAALVLLVALAGCGSGQPKTAVVKGTVMFKGAPVPNGTITFIPTSGPSATGEIQRDGSYTLTTFRTGDGAVLGNHVVIVVAMQDQGDRLPEARTPLPPPIVPNQYTSAATSDLRAEVKDQENTINFTLVEDKKKR